MQVKLRDPCLSALEVVTTMGYTNRCILYFTLVGRVRVRVRVRFMVWVREEMSWGKMSSEKCPTFVV